MGDLAACFGTKFRRHLERAVDNPTIETRLAGSFLAERLELAMTVTFPTTAQRAEMDQANKVAHAKARTDTVASLGDNAVAAAAARVKEAPGLKKWLVPIVSLNINHEPVGGFAGTGPDLDGHYSWLASPEGTAALRAYIAERVPAADYRVKLAWETFRHEHHLTLVVAGAQATRG